MTSPKATRKTKAAVPQPKAAPDPVVVSAPQPVVLGQALRKKELLDATAVRSGQKKKDVKPVVEALLEVLGEALAENRELNLQPFGRVMVRKERPLAKGRMLIAKIRQTKAESGKANAEATEEG